MNSMRLEPCSNSLDRALQYSCRLLLVCSPFVRIHWATYFGMDIVAAAAAVAILRLYRLFGPPRAIC